MPHKVLDKRLCLACRVVLGKTNKTNYCRSCWAKQLHKGRDQTGEPLVLK